MARIASYPTSAQLYNDVTEWCKRCVVCSRRKGPVPKNQVALHPVKVGYPLQIVATDILGPLPKSICQKARMRTCMCWWRQTTLNIGQRAHAIPNQEAETVTKKLTNER